MSLRGKTVAITGATRGVGRGIAIGLAEQGAHIIITGRTAVGESSLESVKQEVEKLGTTCNTYVVDHGNDQAVADWFKQMRRDLSESGRKLDVLVNNAFSAASFLISTMDKPYWQKGIAGDESHNPGAYWDVVNGVGLRGIFICSVHATRSMIIDGGGLIINITSFGSIISLFDPVYGIGKMSIDRMTAEINTAAPKGIQCISFCPGAVSTEAMVADIDARNEQGQEIDSHLLTWNMETPLFVGRSLSALLNDDRLVESAAGKVIQAAEVADKFGIKDENGFQPLSLRSVRVQLMDGLPWIRKTFLPRLIPRSFYVPWYLVLKSMGAYQLWG